MASEWIARGRVRVNGIPAVSPEDWVDLGRDHIEVEGSAGDAGSTAASVATAEKTAVYLMLHKPAGFVTTRSDELGRKTIYDLLPEDRRGGWIFPVGRLDLESEGLLLLTNDGDFSNRLTDPAFHVPKIYRVKLDARPRDGDLEPLRRGIELDGSLTLPARFEADGGSWVKVTLYEGRNRQIRRMFHAAGYKVKRLIRVSMGPLELGDLPEGKCRELGAAEREALERAAGRG